MDSWNDFQITGNEFWKIVSYNTYWARSLLLHTVDIKHRLHYRCRVIVYKNLIPNLAFCIQFYQIKSVLYFFIGIQRIPFEETHI